MTRTPFAESRVEAPAAERRGGPRWPPLVRFLVAILLAWLAAVAVAGVIAARELVNARRLGLTAQEAIAGGDVEAAHRDLAEAETAFSEAEHRLTAPAMWPLRAVPGVRANLRASRSLAAAGGLTAAAGVEMTGAIDGLPGGASALAPSGGAIPLEPIEALTPALQRAEGLLAEAQDLSAAVPERGLVGPVADARRQLVPIVGQAADAVSTAVGLAEVMPTFLGAEEPKRYFFGAGNPAELRGTGGFIGAYTIVTIDEGHIDIGSFDPIHDLETIPPEDADAPSADYADRYDRYGGAGFWLNINMTPDFPSAARAIEGLYEQVTGEAVDGTIVADATTLAGLLQVTGPADVPGHDATVDADNVVAFVSNEAFDRITDPDQRKRLLGAVAATALEGFLHGGSPDPTRALDALSSAVRGGHLLLHSRDDAVQNAFEEAGVDGRLLDTDGDYLAAVVNNAAANKADFYAERTVHYQVALHPEGSAAATAAVELTNATPTEGVTSYVIGPNVEGAAAGDNRSLLSIYCRAGCERTAFRRSLGDRALREETELGHPVFTTMVSLGSGESERVELDWTLDEAWTVEQGEGVYRLTVQDQPTIRPTRLVVDVVVPEGMAVTGASKGFEINAGGARWDGEAPATTTLEVRFASADRPSTWERIRRFLDRPGVP